VQGTRPLPRGLPGGGRRHDRFSLSPPFRVDVATGDDATALAFQQLRAERWAKAAAQHTACDAGRTRRTASLLPRLLQLRQRLLAEGGQLVFVGLQDQPVQVLRLTGAYDLLVAGPADTADVAAA
jgi:hypothetical protein